MSDNPIKDDRNAKDFVNDAISFPMEDINKRLRLLEAHEAPSAYVDVSTTANSYVNTVVEQTVITYEIPANKLIADVQYVCRIFYRVWNASGAPHDLIWKLKYGAATVVTVNATVAVGDDGSAEAVTMLCYRGAANAQRGVVTDNRTDNATAGGLATGDTGTSAQDSTTALDMVVTAQMDFATVGFGFDIFGYNIQRIA